MQSFEAQATADPYFDSLYAPRQELKHSGFGIASFMISIVIGVLIVALIIVAGVLEASTPGGIDENSPPTMMVGLGILALVMADLLAIALGITGLVQAQRRKVFAVLGTIFSGLTILGTVVLIVVGNMMKD